MNGWTSFLMLSNLRFGRLVSNDYLVILESSKFKWGPTPFRFEKKWLWHDNLKEFVKNEWREMDVQGWLGFQFMQKLKPLKERLETWNRETFNSVKEEQNEISRKIQELDRMEGENLSEVLHEERIRLKAVIEEMILREEMLRRQKAKVCMGKRRG